MDWAAVTGKLTQGSRKYRYCLRVLLIGVGLMLIPERETAEDNAAPQETAPVESGTELQEALAQILSQIDGAGEVQVMLTVASGEETVYQTDEKLSGGESGSQDRDTVIITDADRAESGLVRQVNPPVYLGAIVVCQGADRASVKLAIVDAVAKATGLDSTQISVLKMK